MTSDYKRTVWVNAKSEQDAANRIMKGHACGTREIAEMMVYSTQKVYWVDVCVFESFSDEAQDGKDGSNGE